MTVEGGDSLVSVIIPAYNQGAYLADAVESVYAQDYAGPIEVIVIDDGSTDQTARVAGELALRYPALRYVAQPNAGVCRAANRGLELARGGLLLRLDADDYLPPDYVRALAATLRAARPDVAFAYCDAEYVGARRGRKRARPFRLSRLLQANYIHVSAMCRTEALRDVGYFNPNLRHGLEDWDLWLTLAEKGFRGAYCRDTHLFYRQKSEPSRNGMRLRQMWAMRRQVYANHPALYGRPSSRLLLLSWRMRWEARRALVTSLRLCRVLPQRPGLTAGDAPAAAAGSRP
jgi:glycosyltransferase involved in cell wall biosynthesis